MPYRDPTVGFTVLVMSAPPLMHAFEHGVVEGARAAIQYLTSPTMIMSYLFLLAVVTVAHAGPTVKLGKRDRAVAFWFLMNGESATRRRRCDMGWMVSLGRRHRGSC